MLRFLYTPKFLKQYNKLELALRSDVKNAIDVFKKDQFHPSLHTHKLSGKLKGVYSFSINYKYRILFTYETKDIIKFLKVGDHSMYQ